MFASGDSSRPVSIVINDDSEAELPESFVAVIGGASIISGTCAVLVKIIDDEGEDREGVLME